MKNLLSYCGLVDARISASEKDLPVQNAIDFTNALLLLQFFGVTFSSKTFETL